MERPISSCIYPCEFRGNGACSEIPHALYWYMSKSVGAIHHWEDQLDQPQTVSHD